MLGVRIDLRHIYATPNQWALRNLVTSDGTLWFKVKTTLKNVMNHGRTKSHETHVIKMESVGRLHVGRDKDRSYCLVGACQQGSVVSPRLSSKGFWRCVAFEREDWYIPKQNKRNFTTLSAAAYPNSLMRTHLFLNETGLCLTYVSNHILALRSYKSYNNSEFCRNYKLVNSPSALEIKPLAKPTFDCGKKDYARPISLAERKKRQQICEEDKCHRQVFLKKQCKTDTPANFNFNRSKETSSESTCGYEPYNSPCKKNHKNGWLEDGNTNGQQYGRNLEQASSEECHLFRSCCQRSHVNKALEACSLNRARCEKVQEDNYTYGNFNHERNPEDNSSEDCRLHKASFKSYAEEEYPGSQNNSACCGRNIGYNCADTINLDTVECGESYAHKGLLKEECSLRRVLHGRKNSGDSCLNTCNLNRVNDDLEICDHNEPHCLGQCFSYEVPLSNEIRSLEEIFAETCSLCTALAERQQMQETSSSQCSSPWQFKPSSCCPLTEKQNSN